MLSLQRLRKSGQWTRTHPVTAARESITFHIYRCHSSNILSKQDYEISCIKYSHSSAVTVYKVVLLQCNDLVIAYPDPPLVQPPQVLLDVLDGVLGAKVVR